LNYKIQELEEVLQSYPVLKADALIEHERLYNLFPSCIANYSGLPGSPNTSDSTGNVAVARSTITLTMRKVRAIEVAYDCLNQDEKDLVRLHYFERWRAFDVRQKLHMSRSVFFRARRSALDKIAGRLIRPELWPAKNGTKSG
jgi:predicted DNA-binding protein (UPF0251 family)